MSPERETSYSLLSAVSLSGDTAKTKSSLFDSVYSFENFWLGHQRQCVNSPFLACMKFSQSFLNSLFKNSCRFQKKASKVMSLYSIFLYTNHVPNRKGIFYSRKIIQSKPKQLLIKCCHTATC